MCFIFSSLMGVTLGDSKVDDNLFYLYLMIGLSIPLALIRIFGLMFVFNFDTPQYYIEKNQKEKAYKVLEKIYKKDVLQ